MRRFVFAVTFSILYASTVARGNGRFPKAQAMAAGSAVGQGRALSVRATFGVLVSRDDERRFRWLCEEAYGSASTWDATPNTAAFGAYPIRITAPTDFPVTVNFHRSDWTPHEIPADQPQQGFPHGTGLIPAGQDDAPRRVTQSGMYSWHRHDEGDATNVGEIVIMESPGRRPRSGSTGW